VVGANAREFRRCIGIPYELTEPEVVRQVAGVDPVVHPSHPACVDDRAVAERA
jgi:hypothetical protein